MKNLRKNTGGYALLYVMVVIILLCAVAMMVCTVAMQNLQAQQKSVEQMQEKYEAQGEVEKLKAQVEEIDVLNSTSLAKNDDPVTKAKEAYTAKVQSFITDDIKDIISADVSFDFDEDGETGIAIVIIEAKTEENLEPLVIATLHIDVNLTTTAYIAAGESNPTEVFPTYNLTLGDVTFASYTTNGGAA